MGNNQNPQKDQNLEHWYQQTISKLYRFAYALLQNREEAEDITQEAYFRCLRKDKYNLPSYPYLKQVAQNLIYDRYRHWQKRHFQTEDHTLIDLTATEENWIAHAYIEGLLNQLPLHYKQVLELRIVKGYSRKETAKNMNRSEDAIRGLQYRALQALRDLIHLSEENGG